MYLPRLVVWNLVRLWKKWKNFGVGYWSWSPPYEYVFEITSEKVHEYIGKSKDEISRWVIVGGCLGHEIPQIIRGYPNIVVDVFECSSRYLPDLEKRFTAIERVNVIGKAVSSQVGVTIFHETSIPGAGSVLELGVLHTQLTGFKPAEIFEVETTTIDSHYGALRGGIDVLQIDVQGAELLVLKGAQAILEKTSSIFLEVSHNPVLYKNSATMSEVAEFLMARGFVLQLLGNGPDGSGNALFVKGKTLGV